MGSTDIPIFSFLGRIVPEMHNLRKDRLVNLHWNGFSLQLHRLDAFVIKVTSGLIVGRLVGENDVGLAQLHETRSAVNTVSENSILLTR